MGQVKNTDYIRTTCVQMLMNKDKLINKTQRQRITRSRSVLFIKSCSPFGQSTSPAINDTFGPLNATQIASYFNQFCVQNKAVRFWIIQCIFCGVSLGMSCTLCYMNTFLLESRRQDTIGTWDTDFKMYFEWSESWDSRFSHGRWWGFKLSGMWHCVVGRVVPDISKDNGASIFKVNQPSTGFGFKTLTGQDLGLPETI
jgi:hypothetical protein